MRAKTKSFIEDAILLFVVVILIYLAYSFFFSSDEKVEIVDNNKPTIEEKIQSYIHNKEPIVNELKKDEVASEKTEPIVENTLQETPTTQREQIESVVESRTEPVIIEEVKAKEEVQKKEEPISSNVEVISEGKAKIDLFFKNVSDKIYSNIEKNVDKKLIKNGDYVNIRVTILATGKEEQLTFVDGNKELFNLVKASIYQTFPIQMDKSLENNFPRYFRMKIEF